MKKFKLLVFIISIWGISAVAYPQTVEMTLPTGSLTLKKAYKIAIKNNPGIKHSLETVKQAVYKARQAQSSMQPYFGFSGNFMQHNATSQADWAPNMRLNESFNTYSAQLNFQYLLYDGYERRANILAANTAIDHSEQIHFEVRRLLLEAVSGAYMQALLAAENMKIEKSNFEFNQKLEKESKIRWKVGDIPESEAMNFSLRKIQAEAGYINAQKNFKIACTILAELLAIPDAKLSPEFVPNLNLDEISAQEIIEKQQIAYAIKNRPDLKAVSLLVKTLNYQKKAIKNSYAPKLSLVSGLKYESTVDFMTTEQHENSSFIGIQTNFDIHRNGRRKAQMKEIDASIRAQKQDQDKTILNIKSKIGQQICQANSALLILGKQKQALKMTKKIREHVKKLYSSGETNLTRLNEAQNDLVRTSGSVAASLITYKLMLLQLDSTTGKILEGFKPEKKQKIGKYKIISLD